MKSRAIELMKSDSKSSREARSMAVACRRRRSQESIIAVQRHRLKLDTKHRCRKAEEESKKKKWILKRLRGRPIDFRLFRHQLITQQLRRFQWMRATYTLLGKLSRA